MNLSITIKTEKQTKASIKRRTVSLPSLLSTFGMMSTASHRTNLKEKYRMI